MELGFDEINVIIDKCLVLVFIIDTGSRFARLTEKCDRKWSRYTFALLFTMSIIYSHTNTHRHIFHTHHY